MSYSTYAVIMLAAGLGIPVMAALNAALGKIIGNPAGAVVMLLLIAMIAAGAICATSGSLSLTTLLTCLLYTSPSPRDLSTSRMPSSA